MSDQWLDGIVRAGEPHATHLGRAVRISRSCTSSWTAATPGFPRAPRSFLMTSIEALLQRFVVKSVAEYPRDGLQACRSLSNLHSGATTKEARPERRSRTLGVGCLHLVP